MNQTLQQIVERARYLGERALMISPVKEAVSKNQGGLRITVKDADFSYKEVIKGQEADLYDVRSFNVTRDEDLYGEGSFSISLLLEEGVQLASDNFDRLMANSDLCDQVENGLEDVPEEDRASVKEISLALLGEFAFTDKEGNEYTKVGSGNNSHFSLTFTRRGFRGDLIRDEDGGIMYYDFLGDSYGVFGKGDKKPITSVEALKINEIFTKIEAWALDVLESQK